MPTCFSPCRSLVITQVIDEAGQDTHVFRFFDTSRRRHGDINWIRCVGVSLLRIHCPDSSSVIGRFPCKETGFWLSDSRFRICESVRPAVVRASKRLLDPSPQTEEFCFPSYLRGAASSMKALYEGLFASFNPCPSLSPLVCA